MTEWKDATTYSQADTKRTPSVWHANAGKFLLVVHSPSHYEPQQWFASCSGAFKQERLSSTDAIEAQSEALSILKSILTDAIADLDSK